ncbi:hypothetical protein GCM10010483_19360 [Actinokineospora diospyrosa]
MTINTRNCSPATSNVVPGAADGTLRLNPNPSSTNGDPTAGSRINSHGNPNTPGTAERTTTSDDPRDRDRTATYASRAAPAPNTAANIASPQRGRQPATSDPRDSYTPNGALR